MILMPKRKLAMAAAVVVTAAAMCAAPALQRWQRFWLAKAPAEVPVGPLVPPLLGPVALACLPAQALVSPALEHPPLLVRASSLVCRLRRRSR